MKNKILLSVAMLLMLTMGSCHKDADPIVNYAFNDYVSFNEAENSYAGKFRVLWNALNQNYTLWDYEEENGLDWDEVYRKYLPKFVDLDSAKTEVTDSMLKAVLTEVVTPLHDGHMLVEMHNHKTGNFVSVSPGGIRAQDRDDYEAARYFEPYLYTYYANSELEKYQEYDTRCLSQFKRICNTKGIGYLWAYDEVTRLESKTEQTDGDAIMLKGLKHFCTEIEELANAPFTKASLTRYNQLVAESRYLDIPGLEPIATEFIDNGISVKFALTNDHIAYLYLSNFSLTPYLNELYQKDMFPNADGHVLEQIKTVRSVWLSWFTAIQTLHKAGQLKGVIIDVRSNGGGYTNDSRYVIGSLLPSGDIQYGWARFKRGVGRYDFSPLMSQYSFTMAEDHETIDDVPVAVLVNSNSVSMSEMTALTAKQMPNARLIGKRTFGGLCALAGNETSSLNYSGHVGIRNETPVYVYLPTLCIFDIDKKPLDGTGVTPDIEVDFDKTKMETTGRDSQLDRALEYIRNGN